MRRVLLALWLLSGCGYHFVGGPQLLPSNLHALRAPVFRNRTSEPALELSFTQAFRQELERRGVLGGDGADGVLDGEILSVVSPPGVLTETRGLASYRVTVVLRLRVVKKGVVVSATDVSGSEDYLPSQAGDVLLSDANRQAALHRLADTLARDGMDRLSTSG